MLDFSHLLGQGDGDVQTFVGDSANASTHWRTWIKPRGKSMCNIMLIGKGGNGGAGVIGAINAAAGGGGGSSGGITSLTLPLWAVPDVLFLSIAGVNPSTTAISSYVSLTPDVTANNVLAVANGGGAGGNGSGVTGGTAGASAAIATAATMIRGWGWVDFVLAGMAGTAGGGAAAGAALTLPTTGGFITGGTGGAGLPATAIAGLAGGAITGAGSITTIPGGVGGAAETTPPSCGNPGFKPQPGMLFLTGGTGGGSTHGGATGAGLVAAVGGNGAPGCGGGGNGGALTGSVTAGTVGGLGGPAMCIITSW